MSMAEEIKAAVDARPFKPFTIHLNDQRTYSITSGSTIALCEDGMVFAVAQKTFHIVHIAQVAGIEMPMDMVFGETEK